MRHKGDQTGAERRLRRGLEKQFGEVAGEEWRFLGEFGHLDTAVGEEECEPGEGVRYLVSVLEESRRYAALTAQVASPKRRQRRLSASERLVAALRRLQARAAAQFPEVIAWRRRWLPEGLLAPENAQGFLLRRQHRVVIWTLCQALPGSESPARPAADAEVISRRSAWEPQESLERLAAELSERLGWSKAAAKVWLLTGVLPDEPALLIERATRFPGDAGVAIGLPPCSLLRLVVPVFLTPAQVAEQLRRIRSAGGTRLRSLSARTAALLEHVAEHGAERESWRQWRRRYGGYPQFKHFRQAIKRAMLVLHRAVLDTYRGSLRGSASP